MIFIKYANSELRVVGKYFDYQTITGTYKKHLIDCFKIKYHDCKPKRFARHQVINMDGNIPKQTLINTVPKSTYLIL